MNAPFKIETSIPVPTPGRGHASPLTTALRELARAEVGASMFVAAKGLSHQNTLHCRAKEVFGKGNYTARRVDGGYRIWKTAEKAS